MDENTKADRPAGHPLSRPASSDDPMVLSGEQVKGDPLVMIDSLVEEFARIGYDANGIHDLFTRPHFQATHSLTQRFGESVIRARIEETLQRCGVFRVTSVGSGTVDAELADSEQQQGEPENV